ncbi:hypothetical protein D3C79_642450 [compost metagenome]
MVVPARTRAIAPAQGINIPHYIIGQFLVVKTSFCGGDVVIHTLFQPIKLVIVIRVALHGLHSHTRTYLRVPPHRTDIPIIGIGLIPIAQLHTKHAFCPYCCRIVQ